MGSIVRLSDAEQYAMSLLTNEERAAALEQLRSRAVSVATEAPDGNGCAAPGGHCPGGTNEWFAMGEIEEIDWSTLQDDLEDADNEVDLRRRKSPWISKTVSLGAAMMIFGTVVSLIAWLAHGPTLPTSAKAPLFDTVDRTDRSDRANRETEQTAMQSRAQNPLASLSLASSQKAATAESKGTGVNRHPVQPRQYEKRQAVKRNVYAKHKNHHAAHASLLRSPSSIQN